MRLWDRLVHQVEEFLDRHRGPALLLCALFLIGVIFGSLAVRSLEARDRQQLSAYLSAATGPLLSPPAKAGAILLKRALLRDFTVVGALWLLGISVLGAVVVMISALWLGFVGGFTVAYLTAELGGQGVLIALAGHLPQNLVALPALLIGATASIAFSAQVVTAWRDRRRMHRFYPALARYSTVLLGSLAALLVAGLVEAYLTPALMQLAGKVLQ